MGTVNQHVDHGKIKFNGSATVVANGFADNRNAPNTEYSPGIFGIARSEASDQAGRIGSAVIFAISVFRFAQMWIKALTI